MWLLRNDSKGLLYRVFSGKVHVVTRKDGDLVLLGDQSISRKHAQLRVDEDNDNDRIILKDLGSKYGTFAAIGGGELVQLAPNQEVSLNNGDIMKFGIQWNSWRIEFIPLLVVTSTLTQEEKTEVKRVLETLGGTVLSDWSAECSHLTMNKLTVTVKVVCAIASGQPIVTPAYWTSLSEAVSTMQGTLPDCKDFIPPLAEAMLNPNEVSFAPNPERSKLFQGYVFVAASAKQLNRIRPMIAAAGGKIVEFSARAWSEDKLMEDKVILMLSSANEKPGSQQSQVFDGYIPVARKLRQRGIRCIPESEIGLSVIHCSARQFCNPRFNAQLLITNNVSSAQATQHVTVIGPNTEESMMTVQSDENTVPNPHIESMYKKRPLEHANVDQEPSNKRPDLRPNSEDLFNSEDLNKSKASTRTKLSLRNTMSSEKPTVEKQIKVNHLPSLDIFVPSLEKSNESTRPSKVTAPSCEDMFASSSNRTHNNNKESKDSAADEFSFPQKRSAKRPLNKNNSEDEDEFSFKCNKSAKKIKPSIENGEALSFKTNKSSTTAAPTREDEGDLFSFNSVKRPNKRIRQSNPDMFASSAESSVNNAQTGSSKSSNSNLNNKTVHCEDDNLFAFPESHNSKKRRVNNNEMLDLSKMGGEMKLAFLSNNNESEKEYHGANTSKVNELTQEQKNVTIYSKLKPTTTNFKKEADNEEVDELARELYNATIVVVKPLLVKKEVQQQNVPALQTGKNFKKFRKAVGLNKRAVPHIIGGSDLVPHYNVHQDIPARGALPVQCDIEDDNDDDWSFGERAKKINNKRRIF